MIEMKRNNERIFEFNNRIHGISGGHYNNLSSSTDFIKPSNLHLDDLTDHACKLITCMRGLYFKRSTQWKIQSNQTTLLR